MNYAKILKGGVGSGRHGLENASYYEPHPELVARANALSERALTRRTSTRQDHYTASSAHFAVLSKLHGAAAAPKGSPNRTAFDHHTAMMEKHKAIAETLNY